MKKWWPALVAAVCLTLVMPGCGGTGGMASLYALSVTRLKGLNTGLLIYMGDYDDVLPPPNIWADGLGPYVQNSENFHSPAVTVSPYGYALNVDVSGKYPGQLGDLSLMISLFDSTDTNRGATESTGTLPNPPRYGSRNTIAFMDGHVKDELGVAPTVDDYYKQSKDRIKQINLACIMYSTDYDDKLPLAGPWMDDLYLYTKSNTVFRSPLVQLQDSTHYGYAYNAAAAGADTTVVDPSTTLTFFDSTILTRNAISTTATLPSPPRYHTHNTIVYLDGHVP